MRVAFKRHAQFRPDVARMKAPGIDAVAFKPFPEFQESRKRRHVLQAFEPDIVFQHPFVMAERGNHALTGEGDKAADAVREKFFEQNVRPLLAQNCYSCHGEKKQKGGLRLDSIESILKGGESGPAVVPGKPEESLLVSAINYAGPEMPPSGKLAPEKLAVLTAWISTGARWPRSDQLRAGHLSGGRRAVAHRGGLFD